MARIFDFLGWMNALRVSNLVRITVLVGFAAYTVSLFSRTISPPPIIRNWTLRDAAPPPSPLVKFLSFDVFSSKIKSKSPGQKLFKKTRKQEKILEQKVGVLLKLVSRSDGGIKILDVITLDGEEQRDRPSWRSTTQFFSSILNTSAKTLTQGKTIFGKVQEEFFLFQVGIAIMQFGLLAVTLTVGRRVNFSQNRMEKLLDEIGQKRSRSSSQSRSPHSPRRRLSSKSNLENKPLALLKPTGSELDTSHNTYLVHESIPNFPSQPDRRNDMASHSSQHFKTIDLSSTLESPYQFPTRMQFPEPSVPSNPTTVAPPTQVYRSAADQATYSSFPRPDHREQYTTLKEHFNDAEISPSLEDPVITNRLPRKYSQKHYPEPTVPNIPRPPTPPLRRYPRMYGSAPPILSKTSYNDFTASPIQSLHQFPQIYNSTPTIPLTKTPKNSIVVPPREKIIKNDPYYQSPLNFHFKCDQWQMNTKESSNLSSPSIKKTTPAKDGSATGSTTFQNDEFRFRTRVNHPSFYDRYASEGSDNNWKDSPPGIVPLSLSSDDSDDENPFVFTARPDGMFDSIPKPKRNGSDFTRPPFSATKYHSEELKAGADDDQHGSSTPDSIQSLPNIHWGTKKRKNRRRKTLTPQDRNEFGFTEADYSYSDYFTQDDEQIIPSRVASMRKPQEFDFPSRSKHPSFFQRCPTESIKDGWSNVPLCLPAPGTPSSITGSTVEEEAPFLASLRARPGDLFDASKISGQISNVQLEKKPSLTPEEMRQLWKEMKSSQYLNLNTTRWEMYIENAISMKLGSREVNLMQLRNLFHSWDRVEKEQRKENKKPSSPSESKVGEDSGPPQTSPTKLSRFATPINHFAQSRENSAQEQAPSPREEESQDTLYNDEAKQSEPLSKNLDNATRREGRENKGLTSGLENDNDTNERRPDERIAGECEHCERTRSKDGGKS